METVGVASERSELICPGLSAEATEAIINSRAVSTRRLYAFKWKLFTTWYRRRDMDPAYYPVASVLEFLQNFFSEGAMPATLKVYVVAISANHAYIDSVSVGRHPLVSRFMQGSRRLQPIRPARVPSWDPFRVSPAILKTFYSGAIESVLTQCISVWYNNATNQDCKALQRVVRLAERISGSALPSLQDIYLKRCKSRAAKIIKDSTHPGNHHFCLLPSGKRFRSMMAKTERLRRSFFPQAIRLLNSVS